jgi:arabinofuranosyltransferase
MSRFNKLVCLFLLLVAAVILVRNAWVCDDAYISFRTVDNAVNGFGLRWNVAERVQAYTHPLWVLLLIPIYALSGEIYYTCLVISIVVTLVTLVWWLFKIAPTLGVGLSGVCLLLLSKPWIDFSVSGLENPLSHLMTVLFFGAFHKRELDWKSVVTLGLTASLAAMTRLDLLAMLGPMLLFVFAAKDRWRLLPWVAIGMLPLVVWESFSLWYYGFPVPNTAYAKLAAGIASTDLMHQGQTYLLNAASHSPFTAAVIAITILGALFHLKNARYLLGVIGISLYLTYIIKVGGDFMSGRFLSPVFLLAALMLVTMPPPLPRWGKIAGAVLLVAVGLFSPRSPIFAGSSYGTGSEGSDWDSGISDERAAYYPTTGLLNNFGLPDPPKHPWAQQGREIRASDSTLYERPGTGFLGFFAGPKLYIIDRQGLSDPLLARLPIPTPKKWRIGHFNRVLPEGYFETLRTGQNQIKNPNLANYYDLLTIVTRGDPYSLDRLRLIWRLNRGDYGHLIEKYWQRPLHQVTYDEINRPQKAGTRFNGPGCLLMTPTGISIDLKSIRHDSRLEVSLDGNDRYQVTFLWRDSALQHVVLHPPHPAPTGLRLDTVQVADSVRLHGYTGLFIKPGGGDSTYALGHVRLIE